MHVLFERLNRWMEKRGERKLSEYWLRQRGKILLQSWHPKDTAEPQGFYKYVSVKEAAKFVKEDSLRRFKARQELWELLDAIKHAHDNAGHRMIASDMDWRSINEPSEDKKMQRHVRKRGNLVGEIVKNHGKLYEIMESIGNKPVSLPKQHADIEIQNKLDFLHSIGITEIPAHVFAVVQHIERDHPGNKILKGLFYRTMFNSAPEYDIKTITPIKGMGKRTQTRLTASALHAKLELEKRGINVDRLDSIGAGIVKRQKQIRQFEDNVALLYDVIARISPADTPQASRKRALPA